MPNSPWPGLTRPPSGRASARPETPTGALTNTFSLAREIVGPDRVALRRPSPLAPIIDQPDLAHQRLEPFRLAHCREGSGPEQLRRGYGRRVAARLDDGLI